MFFLLFAGRIHQKGNQQDETGAVGKQQQRVARAVKWK